MCWSLCLIIPSTGQLVSYEEFGLVGDPLLMKG